MCLLQDLRFFNIRLFIVIANAYSNTMAKNKNFFLIRRQYHTAKPHLVSFRFLFLQVFVLLVSPIPYLSM